MIYIKVELWPYGDESKKQKIAEAKIANTGTGDAFFGNYKYVINENTQDTNTEIKKGFIFEHERKQGVWILIKKVLMEAYKQWISVKNL